MQLVRKTAPWVIGLIVVILIGTVLPTYWTYLLSTVAVSALVARSVGLVTNQAGLITLSQMSFAAIGGWVVSWISFHYPEAFFPLIVLAGGICSGIFGLLLGLATLRIRGIELAVITLGFAAALDLILGRTGFPGSGQGIAVLPSAPFSNPLWYYWLTWIALLALHLVVRGIGRTTLGLSWTSVRISERATAALGIRVGLAKVTAFGFGALFAGVAGGLLAGQYGLLSAAVFSPLTSMVYFATALMTGASLLGGAILAGALIVFVPETLRRLGIPLDVGNAIFALGAFDVLRRGHGGIAEQLNQKLQTRKYRQIRTSTRLGPKEPSRKAVEGTITATPALVVNDLTVSFGKNVVLDDVSLDVREGEVHALIGPNGAGKSTFVDAVSGFLPNYQGQVLLGSENLDRLSARERAGLGLRRTFQQSRVIDGISVDEYLRLASRGHHQPERLDQLAEFFGLPQGDVPVALMDIGSRRILEIAGTLAASPQVVLLDEPASGLSEEDSFALAQRIRAVPSTFGCSVLLIEHDMTFVRTASDRITVLDYGELICSGDVEEVLANPLVIAAYLGKEVTA